jgi:hypothetical protein
MPGQKYAKPISQSPHAWAKDYCVVENYSDPRQPKSNYMEDVHTFKRLDGKDTAGD